MRAPFGGYFVYLSDGDVPFLRVSFSPSISRTGHQKKAIFLEPIVKACQKGKIFVDRVITLSRFLCFGVYFSTIIFRIRHYLKAMIPEPGKEKNVSWAPSTNLGQIFIPLSIGMRAILYTSIDMGLKL